MYNCSNAFHTAVANGEPQKLMMIFPDAVFTEADIDIARGIEFRDYFNTQEDLHIGGTPSNEFSFDLFNGDGLLDNYAFGEFLATLGVLVYRQGCDKGGNVLMTVGNNVWIGDSQGQENPGTPRLKKNGSAVGSPPSFDVYSLMCYDGKVYAFSENGQQCAVYNESSGADITASTAVIPFMRNKAKGWRGKGIYYDKRLNVRQLTIQEDGVIECYEFVPLGYFIADRPNVPDKHVISFQCYDLMQRFEKDMPKASELGITYPTTIGTLYQKLCQKAGLPYRTLEFTNSGAEIESEPEEFANCTMRTVLGWIAEAAGSTARIDRDGYVALAWVRSSSISLDEHRWESFDPYWYQTKRINKLYVRDTGAGSETVIGAENAAEYYLIQDNPLLRGATFN